MKFKLLYVLFLFVFLFSCASKHPSVSQNNEMALEGLSQSTKDNGQVYDENEELITEDLDYFDHEKELKEGFKAEPEFDIPMVMNAKVEMWIDYFKTRGKKFFIRWLSRSGKYIPMMKKILRENGLPEDLVYLAMIESGFKPYAYSRARAVGPWQFIRRTGTRYGLKVTWCLDERRDPEKSTIAAAQHLKDLNDQFKHWYLAAAGYNAGAGKISRAMKKYSTEDFWEMSKYRYLRKETKNYVPKMIAAAMLAKNPEKYEFTNIKYQDPLEYDKVIVSRPTDLKSIAKAIGTDYKTIKNLNPELLRWFTPPNYPNYELKIPKGSTDKFELARAQFKDVKISGTVKHRVRRGQTLSHIARSYGTSVRSIMAFNNIRNPRRVRAGKILHIPVRKGSHARTKYKKYTRPDDYVLKRGETLSHVAKYYRTDVGVLLAANELSNPNEVKVGQTIHIPAKGSKISKNYAPRAKHVLKKGETLSHVADNFGTSIRSLMAYNNIRNPRRIRAGQTIYVPARPTKKHLETSIDVASFKEKLKADGAIGYTVKRGDTLWSISRAFNVTVAEIRKWNKIRSRRMIHPGDELAIYPRFINENGESHKNIGPSSAVASKLIKTHIVRKGDTLWDISREYKVSVNRLLSLNNLRSGMSIRPGEVIKLTN